MIPGFIKKTRNIEALKLIDTVDKKTRSRMMSGIRSKNTKPEILVRKALYHAGYRYRLETKIQKIKPDLVLTKQKIAIFINGCFWHHHNGCKLGYTPKSKLEFWENKFEKNIERDRRTILELKKLGWRVAIIWECATRKEIIFKQTIKSLLSWIQSEVNEFESGYKER